MTMIGFSMVTRCYCRKSFTLPKTNFLYKEVENSKDNKFSNVVNKPKYDSFKSKPKYCKNFLSDEVIPDRKPNNKSSLGTNDYGRTFVPDNQKAARVYSRDLLEMEESDFINEKKRIKSHKKFDDHRKINMPKQKHERDKFIHRQNIKFPLFRDGDREIIYGIFPALLALQAQRRSFYKLYIKKDILEANQNVKLIYDICRTQGIPAHQVHKNQLQHLTSSDAVHQGICLEASSLPIVLAEENRFEISATQPNRCWLYLNEINDPMNLGAILRTAYFLGVDRVLCSQANSCPITSVVSKASSGVAELFPVYTVSNDVKFLTAAQDAGWQIVSTSSSTKNCIDLKNIQPNNNFILIIGNEGRGITKELLEISDICVKISPHHKHNQDMLTLNASVATSIILYSLLSKL